MSGSGTGIVTPYNTHRGTAFDGAADNYTRAADLLGNADGPLGLFSCYFRVDGGALTNRYILSNANDRFVVSIDTLNRINILARDLLGNIDLRFRTVAQYTVDNLWHHLLSSWNTAVGGNVYVDGAVAPLAINIVNNDTLDYTRVSWGVGASPAGAVRFDGGLSEIYFALAAMDITVQANRDQFRHPNGQPPSLLADGSGPIGAQPIVYLVEEGGVMVNRGSGGAFAAVGAPALSADSPKDRWVSSLNYGTMSRLQPLM